MTMRRDDQSIITKKAGLFFIIADNVSPISINVDQIRARTRDAPAFGSADATSKVKMVNSQQLSGSDLSF